MASAKQNVLVNPNELILITGASGFIGSRVVDNLIERGYRNLRCFTRHSSHLANSDVGRAWTQEGRRVEIFKGNLLSMQDCIAAARDATVIIHLAAGRGEKSFPDAYLNSVVTTRNLLEAAILHNCLRRFVNVSSFAVYSNTHKPLGRILDERCPVETHPELRGEAYCFAKVKQDEIVQEYSSNFGIPYVIVRPGYVLGPGKSALSGRVGIDTFGRFLHLGGSNLIPFSYVDNCAEAIALAALTQGVDGEVFNVVDDGIPSSRYFLRLYKTNVKAVKSLYIPHFLSFVLCYIWESYASWSQGQLPPVFNRRRWSANWKKTMYSNEKVKSQLHWRQKVPFDKALQAFFESCREHERQS